jgi:predicted alpha-1,2-mannosidase
MAIGLGKKAEASQLQPRCDAFKNNWDNSAASLGFTGFPQARAADGTFVPTDQVVNGPGFKEGTAWQYQWLAQQDPQTLFSLMGGSAQAQARLDTFFAMPAVLANPGTAAADNWVTGSVDYAGHYQFNPNNEPDFHAPWMYAWTDSPWKTSAVTRAQRALYTDDHNGIPGNDDLGATSALGAFEMMGIFEAQPGTGNYIFSAPMFPKIVITQPDGHKTTINTPGASSTTLQYVKSVAVDGQKTDHSWISHQNLVDSHQVNFKLTTDPASTQWGLSTKNQPPAMLGAIPAAKATVTPAARSRR